MSLSVPANIEPEIIQYAQAEHITADEAIVRLIQVGLREKSTPSPAEQMWGAFSSPEDVAMLDDIVQEAYERRQIDQPRDFGY